MPLISEEVFLLFELRLLACQSLCRDPQRFQFSRPSFELRCLVLQFALPVGQFELLFAEPEAGCAAFVILLGGAGVERRLPAGQVVLALSEVFGEFGRLQLQLFLGVDRFPADDGQELSGVVGRRGGSTWHGRGVSRVKAWCRQVGCVGWCGAVIVRHENFPYGADRNGHYSCLVVGLRREVRQRSATMRDEARRWTNGCLIRSRSTGTPSGHAGRQRTLRFSHTGSTVGRAASWGSAAVYSA